jgi:hypothetical protein
VEIAPKIVYTFIGTLEDIFGISSRDIKKMKIRQKARGEFFHQV